MLTTPQEPWSFIDTIRTLMHANFPRASQDSRTFCRGSGWKRSGHADILMYGTVTRSEHVHRSVLSSHQVISLMR